MSLSLSLLSEKKIETTVLSVNGSASTLTLDRQTTHGESILSICCRSLLHTWPEPTGRQTRMTHSIVSLVSLSEQNLFCVFSDARFCMSVPWYDSIASRSKGNINHCQARNKLRMLPCICQRSPEESLEDAWQRDLSNRHWNSPHSAMFLSSPLNGNNHGQGQCWLIISFERLFSFFLPDSKQGERKRHAR